MRVTWRALLIDVVDYEILRIGEDVSMAPLGDFRDAYFSDGPPWRLVAGYLMAAESAPGGLALHSHGRAVADLVLSPDTVVLRTRGAGGPWADAPVGIHTSGIAVIPGDGATWRHREAGTVEVDRADGWSLSVVHGPADAKIDARRRLLASLEAVGGRRG